MAADAETTHKATAILRARTEQELENMRRDLVAQEVRLKCQRSELDSAERMIEWDRVCCQLGVRQETEAQLREREQTLRNLRVQWQARDTATQHVRVRLEEEQAWRLVLPWQLGARRAAPDERDYDVHGAILAFFEHCRKTYLKLDDKVAAPALRFTPYHEKHEPPSDFVLTVTVASDGRVQAADEEGAYRHFNLLQDHPSERFVR